MTKPGLAEPSTPLLADRMKTVFRQLPKALAGDTEAVHQLRVAGRRLRVALPLLAKKPRGRRVRRALAGLRELTGTAGGSRDLDVILGLFEQRVRSVGAASAQQRLLLRSLRAGRARSRKRMADALMDLEIARLRRDLRAVLARRCEGLFTVLLRVRQRRDEEGAAILKALGELGQAYDTGALHQIRMRCRRLRYTAELVDALRGVPSEAPALLKDLQERLGRVHDAFVLASWLGRQAASATARGKTALAAEAAAEQQFFLDTSRATHGELLAAGPAELVQRAMAAMGGARSAA